jgi:hypothetical protein
MGYQLIETIEVGSGGAASIEFTGIDGTGQDLVCLVSMRTNKASGNPDAIEFRFNGTASNYSTLWLEGTGSAVVSGNFTSTRGYAEHIAQHAAYTTNTFGNTSIYISNYASSSAKSISVDGVTENNATASYQLLAASKWNNTAAITSLLLYSGGNTLLQYSTASLYKITAD